MMPLRAQDSIHKLRRNKDLRISKIRKKKGFIICDNKMNNFSKQQKEANAIKQQETTQKNTKHLGR